MIDSKQTKIIIGYSIVATILLFITENLFHPTYAIQMIQKILTFLIIPILLGKYLGFKHSLFGKINKESIYYGVSLGIVGATIIYITYLLLDNVIDWGAIYSSISSRGVNSTTFILVFTYIMFGNSLVEEYFFRGVVFGSLLHNSRYKAYILSSSMFSLYHIAIFGTWFKGYILFISLIGLFLGGMFFAWLYEKTSGIWGAWIFHIIADLVILIMGYLKFFS